MFALFHPLLNSPLHAFLNPLLHAFPNSLLHAFLVTAFLEFLYYHVRIPPLLHHLDYSFLLYGRYFKKIFNYGYVFLDDANIILNISIASNVFNRQAYLFLEVIAHG
ncbi:MAG: hypothetical protein BWY96_01923 [Spirochaetes bacterium ADurb.BinA120]|nr:MAG: hypothetical protein BWY96_01923 [Spirochaetes bacterium ADurb.BinA120]